MICPHCDALLSDKQSQCPRCGANAVQSKGQNELLKKLDSLQKELQASKNAVLSKFTQLEQLTADLQTSVSGSAKIETVQTTQATVTAEKQSTPTSAVTSSASAKQDSLYAPPLTPTASSASKPASPPPKKGSSEIAVGQKWLLICGIIITVFGIGYFIKYSFDQNWIGPAGRIALGYLAAACLLGGGEKFRRHEDYRGFGLTLVGGGIATLYFSTFAAYQMYQLIGQVPAFGLMTLTTCLAGGLALKYDHRPTAVLGLIGGFVTPLLLDSGSGNYQALFTYMLLLNLGVFSLSFFKQWSILNYLGFFFTWSIFTGWYFDGYSNEKFWITTFFLNAFFVIYAAAPFAFYSLKRRAEPLKGFGISIPNAALAFAFSYNSVERYAGLPAVGIVSIAYAALYLGFAQLLYKRDSQNTKALVPLMTQAAVFLVITVPVLASAQWITVFWAIQCVVLFWAATRLDLPGLYRGVFLLLIVTCGRFLIFDCDSYNSADVYSHVVYGVPYSFGSFLNRFFAAASVVIGLGVIAYLVTTHEQKCAFIKSWHKKFLWAAFGGILFYVLNGEVRISFFDSSPAAQAAAVSVLWTLCSIATIAVGFRLRLSAVRKCALALFALTVLKVFTVDMEHVSAPFRILSFVVLGIVLIFASFLYYRYRDRIT